MVSSFGATASPVTPPIFHLFGSGFGHPGSKRYRGAPCAPTTTYKASITRPRPTAIFFTRGLYAGRGQNGASNAPDPRCLGGKSIRTKKRHRGIESSVSLRLRGP